ncbi:MAG: tRNA (adenosine(37)-N6)-threonylcarbamoyltransferase complex transferase subunit TsaD [Candidatus Paceibacterota bacterium]
MRILAIETSCDETAIALIEAKGDLKNPCFKILKNLVASQIKVHQPFGGIVPNLAKREHLKNLPILFNKILKTKNCKLKTDLITVTVGPGLEPCLWVGINFAEDLAKKWNKPLIGVNHLEGHLYSNLLNPSAKGISASGGKSNILYPAVSLIISGGHTILLLMKNLTSWKKLGETRDDAVGEAFDKVARMLNLPYPGGPEIEKLAKLGNSEIEFPRPMLNQKNYDFSFSGLKTSVLYYLRDNKLKTKSYKLKANIAASFQAAAFDVLISKTLRLAKEFKAKSILISGGVAVNKTLQKQFKREIKNRFPLSSFHFPPSSFCGDNAAMVAAAGYINFLQPACLALPARIATRSVAGGRSIAGRKKKRRPHTKSSALVRGKLTAQSNLNL